MPYYHVVIKTKDIDVPYELYDLDNPDLSAIKEDIIIPYLKKEDFFFSGYFLDRDKIKGIVIRESDCSLNIDLKKPFATNEIEYNKDISNRVIRECKSLLNNTPNIPKVPMDKSKVFIVHGHAGEAKEAVARFVENLGFEAIILHEQASSGNTIIEKIEANSNVGFAIVLYTPCDLGASKEEKDQLKPRARQNVIFEHGYIIGKIGRKNVCHLFKSGVETPSDIDGLIYAQMDEGGGWKLAVAKEMKKSGYDVDLNKI